MKKIINKLFNQHKKFIEEVRIEELEKYWKDVVYITDSYTGEKMTLDEYYEWIEHIFGVTVFVKGVRG